MMNTKDMTKGQKFLYDGEAWVCTSNDGFIFSADNLNSESNRHNFMFIGMSEDVEIID